MVAGKRDGADARSDQCLALPGVGPSITIKPHRNHSVILSPKGNIQIGVAIWAFYRAVGLCFHLDEETKASSKGHHLVTESLSGPRLF